jgi:hypothetical protein
VTCTTEDCVINVIADKSVVAGAAKERVIAPPAEQPALPSELVEAGIQLFSQDLPR